eukprot:TRINITY_DN1976_c0_g1_i1.p1 TRINITY_DN1976_c0_g1~~TRINITY_DN1976_c0_g1_i1.p1  ORF type:complete len:301 (-),score=46.29 TRINITY_DN1976_c0_g1_i1:93-995(-)
MESYFSERTLRLAQAISGVGFTSFLSLHIVNALFANFGPVAYDEIQRLLRFYYQHPIVEPLVIGSSLLIHEVVSLMRIYRRRNRKEIVQNPELVYHRYTGYIILAFITGHILSTRGAYLLDNIPSNSSLISFTLEYWPLVFYPYYAVFSISGFYHNLYGLRKVLPMLYSHFMVPGQSPFSSPDEAEVATVSPPAPATENKTSTEPAVAAANPSVFVSFFRPTATTTTTPSALLHPSRRRSGWWTAVTVAGGVGLVCGLLALGGVIYPVYDRSAYPLFQRHMEYFLPAFLVPISWKNKATA